MVRECYPEVATFHAIGFQTDTWILFWIWILNYGYGSFLDNWISVFLIPVCVRGSLQQVSVTNLTQMYTACQAVTMTDYRVLAD